MNTDFINVNNDNMNYEALKAYQRKCDKGKDTQKDLSVFIAEAAVAIQQEDGRGAVDVWCNSQTQQQQPQGMFLYCMGDENWQTHHAKLEAHMWHNYYLRGILAKADKKDIRVIGGQFCASNTEGSD